MFDAKVPHRQTMRFFQIDDPGLNPTIPGLANEKVLAEEATVTDALVMHPANQIRHGRQDRAPVIPAYPSCTSALALHA